MSNILGTNVAAGIVPFTTADAYPTHHAAYGKGGWRSVVDIAARDAIPLERLEEGSATFVEAEQKVFVYFNSVWVDISEVITFPDSPVPVSISSAALSDNGHLLLFLSDGTTIDAGSVQSGSNTNSHDVDWATTSDVLKGTSASKALTPVSIADLFVLADEYNNAMISMAANMIMTQALLVSKLAVK